ncbi:MAG: hypothetical protein H8D35_02160 [Nitrosopumilus sp.]|nr:hypothetical protein [Nitrosopumilus sp.]
MEVVEYLKPLDQSRKKTPKPVIIKWKDVKMVRNHSIRAVAHEIKNMSANQDFISINVIGKQSTGKTELCKNLACLVHQMADVPYNVLHLGKEELLNLEETMSNLKPTNHILIFDDIAFLSATASKQQIDQIQQVLSVIRHLKGGKDVKIILFKSFQYTKAISPFMRQNDMTFISSVDDNEMDNLITLLGKKNLSKINLLRKMQVQVKIGEKDKSYFHYPLGNKDKMYFKYHAKHPFLPYLYYNGSSCRMVVSCLRTFHTPICQVCDNPKESDETSRNLELFVNDFTTKFGTERNAKSIIKIMMMQAGKNCYNPRVAQGVRYVEKFLEKKLLSLDELAKVFNVEPTKTVLHHSKQPDFEVKP